MLWVTLRWFMQGDLWSIHTCDLLGVNYLLHNRLYCTKWALSHLLFGQLLHGVKSSIMGYVPIFFEIVWTEKFTQ